MALINVKKKIEKAAGSLGIAEPIEAACTTNPSGTMKRMVGAQVGGAIGAALTARGGSADPETGMAAQFPTGQHFLVLTSSRLILTKVGAMTGKPKEIVAEWPRADVVGIEIEKGKMADALTIGFSDGTVVQVEGAKGTNPAALAEAFASVAA